MRSAKTRSYIVRAKNTQKKQVVVCQIDRNQAEGHYFIRKEVPQYQYLSTIELSGFKTLPAGLKRSGAGFTGKGYLILKTLSDNIGAFSLTIKSSGETSIRKDGKKYQVELNHADLKAGLAVLSRINSEKFSEQKNAAHAHLKRLFPKHFSDPPVNPLLYRAGLVASLLTKEDILKNLSRADIEQLNDFFPEFLSKFGQQTSFSKKLLTLSKSKRAVEIVYIEKIVQKFESSLKKQLSENRWQDFLREYILIFNSNYARVLEKESLSLRGSYPDFILIDAYNYLDIYEIKMPRTPLLRYDKSHDNHYWSPDISKAVAQVEGYLAHAEQSGALLKEDLRLRIGVDVRVLKPRGFIVAGTRGQLRNENMENSFRILNNSLKNIHVVLYDDLLDNLKNFLGRLTESRTRGRRKRSTRRGKI
jgi:hypothetical protein